MQEASNKFDLEVYRRCIQEARKFARKHFRADMCQHSTLLDPPCFDVVFPDVDLMKVTPMLYGQPCGPSVEYRLRFKKNDGGVYWHPTELLFGIRKLPDIPVMVDADRYK